MPYALIYILPRRTTMEPSHRQRGFCRVPCQDQGSGQSPVLRQQGSTLMASALASMTCANSSQGCRCCAVLPPVGLRATKASMRARLPASSIRSIACGEGRQAQGSAAMVEDRVGQEFHNPLLRANYCRYCCKHRKMEGKSQL